MNCFDCKTPCAYSNPLGWCYKEQDELVCIGGSPGNGPWDKGYKPADAMKAPEEGYWLRALSDEALTKELEMRKHPLFDAASNLVDAVERYMRQECLRSELANAKEKLKELLK